MNNIINQVAYLRTSRNFPPNLSQLTVEVDKSYVDIANAVNNRTISLFPANVPAITGENWFITNQRQQTLRQIYAFGTINPGVELDIPTNITNFVQFTKISGTVITLNGSSGLPDYRPLPYLDVNAIGGGITILVGNIIVMGQPVLMIRIVNGALAPVITSGIAVLEWMSAV